MKRRYSTLELANPYFRGVESASILIGCKIGDVAGGKRQAPPINLE
jgi:hypothetical protein